MNYGYIVQQINSKGDMELIVKFLNGLSHCVNMLGEHADSYANLTRSIFTLEIYDVNVGNALVSFLQVCRPSHIICINFIVMYCALLVFCLYNRIWILFTLIT